MIALYFVFNKSVIINLLGLFRNPGIRLKLFQLKMNLFSSQNMKCTQAAVSGSITNLKYK